MTPAQRMNDRERRLCPSCRAKGRTVPRITVESLLTAKALQRASTRDGHVYCPTRDCELVYFHPETGEQYLPEDLRVRVGMKESEAPRPVCYCFDHTIEAIEADVAASGSSLIPAEIVANCRQGLDRCAETNPQGSCCLGNVNGVLLEAQSRRAETATSGTQNHRMEDRS